MKFEERRKIDKERKPQKGRGRDKKTDASGLKTQNEKQIKTERERETGIETRHRKKCIIKETMNLIQRKKARKKARKIGRQSARMRLRQRERKIYRERERETDRERVRKTVMLKRESETEGKYTRDTFL